MLEFKIKPNGFKEMSGPLYWRFAVMSVFLIGVLIWLNPCLGIECILFDVFMIAILIWSIYRTIKRQRKLLESYVLLIKDSTLIRRQENTPTISLPFSEIKEIVRYSNGMLQVRGASSWELILVPPQIEHPQELEKALLEIRPFVDTKVKPWYQILNALSPLIGIGFVVALFYVSNKIVLGLMGAVLTATFIWTFVYLLRSKNVDRESKRSFYILPLGCLILVSIIVWKLKNT